MRCSTIELANAYSTLANGGTREDAHVIRSVSVRNGKTYEYKTKSTEVLSEGAALHDVHHFGESSQWRVCIL